MPIYDRGKCKNSQYFLRAVVCHTGEKYGEGHYRCLICEQYKTDGKDVTIYHEVNDKKQFVHTEDTFLKIIAKEGYIYHYSKRTSGNLIKNNFDLNLPKGTNLTKISDSYNNTWRKKFSARENRNKRESNNNWVWGSVQKKLRSDDKTFGDFFSLGQSENTHTSCYGFSQMMCSNWNTSCEFCRRKYPTEEESHELCYVEKSEKIKQKGLFAKVSVKKNRYICRYDGVVVDKGSKGQYVVAVDSIYYDAQNCDILARYANHSCEPNCILQKVSLDLEVAEESINPFRNDEYKSELWLKSTTDIDEGDELTFDYGEAFFFEETCLCGFCK